MVSIHRLHHKCWTRMVAWIAIFIIRFVYILRRHQINYLLCRINQTHHNWNAVAEKLFLDALYVAAMRTVLSRDRDLFSAVATQVLGVALFGTAAQQRNETLILTVRYRTQW